MASYNRTTADLTAIGRILTLSVGGDLGETLARMNQIFDDHSRDAQILANLAESMAKIEEILRRHGSVEWVDGQEDDALDLGAEVENFRMILRHAPHSTPTVREAEILHRATLLLRIYRLA